MVVSTISSQRPLPICAHLHSREAPVPLDLSSAGPTTTPATNGGGVPLRRTSTVISPKAKIVGQAISVAVEDQAPTEIISAGVMMGVASFFPKAHLIEFPNLLVKPRLEVLTHSSTQTVGPLQVTIAFHPETLLFLNMGWTDVASPEAAKRCLPRLDIVWEGQLHFNRILHLRAP